MPRARSVGTLEYQFPTCARLDEGCGPMDRVRRVHLTALGIAGEIGSTMPRRRQKQETGSCSAASRVAFDAAQASSCSLLTHENPTICHYFNNPSAGGRIIKRRCSVLTVRRRMVCLSRPKSACRRRLDLKLGSGPRELCRIWIVFAATRGSFSADAYLTLAEVSNEPE